jgi:xeroderma pigmentosum group C-complementing protein
MTGFDVKGGRSVPRFEGVVVCQEFEESVMQTYRELEQAAVDRAEKRRMKSITDNWKRLVRGSIVHSRVMREVMRGAEDNELAFVPGAAAHATPAGGASSNSSSVAATSYGALANALHSAAATPATSTDGPHTHAYSQRVFDLETNA